MQVHYKRRRTVHYAYLVLMMLLQLFDERRSLLVLAALVLEPDADDARAEPGHLDELVLHQRVRSRVGRVARAQRVQLLLVQNGPYARRLRRTATAVMM